MSAACLDSSLVVVYILPYFFISALTILVYDHALTLADEIQYIWKHRWTRFSVLFIINRYFAISTIIAYLWPILTEIVHLDDEAAIIPSHLNPIILATCTSVVMLLAEATLVLRVHAVYNKNKIILGSLVFGWIIHVVAVFMAFSWGHENFDGMPYHFTLILEKRSKLLLIIPAILLDATVGMLLTLGVYRQMGFRLPLIRLIVVDGTMYLAVVFVSNILWVTAGVTLEDCDGIDIPFNALEVWSACITATMISRLSLNIRACAENQVIHIDRKDISKL